MRNVTPYLAVCLALAIPQSLATAGDLDPPAGPVAPTMKDLDSVEPSTPISQLPFTIIFPKAYHLTQTLIGSSGIDGITIDCPTPGTVEIDFRGFTIDSSADAESTIRIPGTNVGDITLKRGYLRGGKRMTKADLISAQANARMKARPLIIRLDRMTLADATLEAIQILPEHTLIIEDSIITGAGSHAIETDGLRTVLDNVQILSVGGDGVHIPASTREHILLGRQVSIADTDGDAVDASNSRATIRASDFSAALGAGLIVGDGSELHRVLVSDIGTLAISAGKDLVLHDSHTTGSIISGAYINARRNIMTIDIDAANTITFADGLHGIAHNSFNIHGTSTANLPAITIAGDNVSVFHNQFNVLDTPTGPPTTTFRMPPHFVSLNGLRYDFHHNTVNAIHAGTEAVIATGDAHVITDNLITGVGQNATGLIYTGDFALIARNTFSNIGPAGTPVLMTGTGNILAPIITGSAIGANCSPDRNLHITN